jgi:hypothetical protein
MADLCACGCGEPLGEVKHPHLRKYRKGFKPGHSSRVRPAPTKAYAPTPEETPSGICECGCGQQTAIVNHTNRKRRHFRGHPAPYCHGHGRRTHGPDHHLFKGIRRTNGYIYEYAPDHPRATIGHDMLGFVLQHRLVWERANGRLVADNEVIHHMNGRRDDNRLENLVCITSSDHAHLHAADHAAGITDETRRLLSEAAKRSWVKRKAAKH